MKVYVFIFFGSCFLFSFVGGKEDLPFSFEQEIALMPTLEQTKQKGLPGGIRLKKIKNLRSKSSHTGMIRHGHVQDPALEWDWGFRTAIGLENLPENLNISATHTQFHTRTFASTRTQTGMLVPTWEDGKKDDSPWLLHLELADMELGKDFALTSDLLIRPHL